MKKIASYALTVILATVNFAAFAQSGTVENPATTLRREAGGTSPRQASSSVKAEKAASTTRTETKNTKRAVSATANNTTTPGGRAKSTKSTPAK
jgi:uncharacterized protein YdeI (BOF family)